MSAFRKELNGYLNWTSAGSHKGGQEAAEGYNNNITIIIITKSGFRKSHSTETLLLRLLSDVLGAVDHCQLTLLALFDVSAAFDTVDHEILLQRLHLSFGVSDTLLSG